jgi:hypothetical protein
MCYKEKHLLFLIFFSINSNNRKYINCCGVDRMKQIERVLIKVIVIQFIFLFFAQLFFHQLDVFPQVKQLTKYEGVNENTYTEILETFQGK